MKKYFKSIYCKQLGSSNNLTLITKTREKLEKGEVRIKVYSAGVNFPDLLMIQGIYQHKPTLPFTPGMELSGCVIEENCNKKELLGKRFIVQMRNGAFSEEIVTKECNLRKVSNKLTHNQAAVYQISTQTAYIAIKELAKIKKNQFILITGSSGGTGSAAIKLAKLLKAKVISLVHNTDKAKYVKSLGSDYVFLYKENFIKEIKRITNNLGVQVIFDTVGGTIFNDTLKCSSWGAKVLIVGFTSGHFSKIISNYVLIKGISIIGVRAGEYLRKFPNKRNKLLTSIEKFSEKDILKPTIYKSFPLIKVAEGLKLLKERKVKGKIVLEITKDKQI